MLTLLLLQAAVSQTAVDAERAFNQAAQDKGQWTAFREYAASDAIMFVPEPVNAHEWLKDRKDPPRSVQWWPARSYVSCDGRLAFNIGGVKRADGSFGSFATVWRLGDDGSWKWRVDKGEDLRTEPPRPKQPERRAAACATPPGANVRALLPPVDMRLEYGQSPDGTLLWRWSTGRHYPTVFTISLWNGRDFVEVFRDGRVVEGQ